VIANKILSQRSQALRPYAFLGAGLLALLVMGTAISYPVGLVLISAGIFEWARRFRAQPKAEDSAGVPSTNPPRPDGPDPRTQLMLMRWSSSFECGHPVIDMQHRELFNVSNEVINSVLDRRPKIGIEYLLHELVEHIKDHFVTEEEVLERTHYPALEDHRNIHQLLLGRATELEQRYREGLLPVSDLVGFIAYDVISTHIIQEDLKFALRNR
jgi:hemerythrin-like metal-binding protein